MQNLVLNRAKLVELDRCDRSFVLSMFHHGLDNDTLKGIGYEVENDDLESTREGQMYDTLAIRNAIEASGGYDVVECESDDPWEKVDNTMELIDQGGPLVIVDGALATNDCIVGFAVLVVREDGMWEVFHLSTKGYNPEDMKGADWARVNSDAMPLLYVLNERYSDLVARFAVIAANKHYLIPYPDPETGMITVDPDQAVFFMDFECGDNLGANLGEDPLQHVRVIYDMLEQDPFYIPEAQMGSQCNKPYACPYKTYCMNRMDPDSVEFHLDYYQDRRNLTNNGYFLMRDLLELSYDYPTLKGLPRIDGAGTFDLSENALRCLRHYEQFEI